MFANEQDILSNYSDHLSVTSSQSASSSSAAAAAVKQRSLEWKSTTFFYSPASLRRKRLNGRSEVVDQIPASPSRTGTDSERSVIPEHFRKDTSSSLEFKVGK